MKEPKPEYILAARLMLDGQMSTARITPYRAARDAMRLCDLARRASTWAVRQCNGIERYDAQAGRPLATWTEADQAACDRSLAKIEKAANEILEPYGAKVLTVHGDPRGCVMKLKLASGAANAGDGWGI